MDVRALSEANMQGAYLSALHGRRVLLFLDNARSAEQIAPLQPPETCAILVTSRWVFPVPGLQNRRVDLLSEKDAVDLLSTLCPRIGEYAIGLAKACAYLPLSLRIAGSFLQVNGNWGTERYISQLNDHKHRLNTLQHNREDAELKSEPDLLATFDLSYGQLSEENKKRWRVLGVFPGSFDTGGAQAIWETKEDESLRSLGLLQRYSLLSYDETSSRYSLHDLLAEYACLLMSEQEEYKARFKHASHYKDVLSTADSFYREREEKVLSGLRLFDLEWGNIRSGHAWTADAHLNDLALAKLCMEYLNVGSRVLRLKLRSGEMFQWMRVALASARKIGDRRGEGNALRELGDAYLASGGSRKTIESYEKQLVIVRENGDRVSEWNTLGFLAMAYANLGDARKAFELHEQQLVIVWEIGDRRGEEDAFNNMGISYEILGETRKAIQFYERQLVVAREIGNQHGEYGALGLLGTAYGTLGEVRKAIEFMEQALGIARETRDRLSEGITLGFLGNAYLDLGDVRKAIELHEQALVIGREFGDRISEGALLGFLGIDYGALGETRKAIEFHQESLRIAREIEHRGREKVALDNLGDAYLALGEVRKGIEYYEQALVIGREISHSWGEVDTLGKLGNAYKNLGETRKAIESYEQGLEIARMIGNRRDEGASLGNLGLAYVDLGETRKAIEFYEQQLVIAREIGDRRGEGNALFNLGLALYSLEEKERAVDLVRQALSIYEAIESPSAKKARNTLKEWDVLP